MEITVLKCDRCKKEVEGLVEFSFINRNIQLDEDAEDNKSMAGGWNEMARLWGLTSKLLANHPTVYGGLCLECVIEFSRWLGHPENSFAGSEEEEC